MKRLYIILSYNVYRVGGIQTYVSAKVDYLKNNQWTVKVLYSSYERSYSVYEPLKDYSGGGFPELRFPPFQLSRNQVSHSLKLMEYFLGDVHEYDTIYMESHDDALSQWGELLAQRIGAQHIILTLNEVYRGPNKHYEEKLDFYDFKYERGELCGRETLVRLFEGHRTIVEADYRLFYINESPVQNFRNERVEQLDKTDWNICYIGRFQKPYVPEVLNGIQRFAARHTEKQIQFVIVGDTNERQGLVQNTLSESPNVKVVELGNLVPIPRSLYGKLDVVIAGSGSARCSAMEGVPTIVVDSERCKAIGLLGYETLESIFWDGSSPLTSVDEALERTLVQKVYEGKTFLYTEPSVAECCEQNFEVFRTASQTKEYYSAQKLCDGKKSVSTIFKYYLLRIFCHLSPDTVDRLRRHLGRKT